MGNRTVAGAARTPTGAWCTSSTPGSRQAIWCSGRWPCARRRMKSLRHRGFCRFCVGRLFTPAAPSWFVSLGRSPANPLAPFFGPLSDKQTDVLQSADDAQEHRMREVIPFPEAIRRRWSGRRTRLPRRAWKAAPRTPERHRQTIHGGLSDARFSPRLRGQPPRRCSFSDAEGNRSAIHNASPIPPPPRTRASGSPGRCGR